ncbi:MAG TPA: FAD-dependent monooxygenase [Phycisphaerales bacterium]|nr:FAD-dependent monooxygenase [Phycisphaerales bacterium]HRQ75456.1 FAD-dependent monooxygenase [Phycisphaerales bacterium]
MPSSDPSSTHIAVIGAGLGGALMACYLAQAGYRVSMYERRSDPRVAGFVGGRSINLALSVRGITALREVGLADKVLAQAIPMRGRMMHSMSGELTFQAYSANAEDAINSVDRGGLNLTLLEAAAAYPNVELHFDCRCVELDLDAPRARFEDATGKAREVCADLIIGADGAFSAVRGQMQKLDRFNYNQQYLEHGYKELTIPPPATASTKWPGFAMEPNALHIWPRGGSMMIALPNRDGSFTCTCFWPYQGQIGFDQIVSEADVVPFFQRFFPDAVPLMPTLAQDYMRNPTSSLVTVRCMPWHYRDKAVLVGDAAHAIVPFFGQGMNAAFEDCRILNGLIQSHAPRWDVILDTFTRVRKADADAIADMALSNFIEMRDKVGSKRFLLKKKTEHMLHRWFPSRFTPLYNLISFSNVPYAEAKRRGEKQDGLLRVAGIALIALLLIAALAAIGWAIG